MSDTTATKIVAPENAKRLSVTTKRKPRRLRNVRLVEAAFERSSLPFIMAFDLAAGTSPYSGKKAMQLAMIGYSIDCYLVAGKGIAGAAEEMDLPERLVSDYVAADLARQEILRRMQDGE